MIFLEILLLPLTYETNHLIKGINLFFLERWGLKKYQIYLSRSQKRNNLRKKTINTEYFFSLEYYFYSD